MAFSPETFALLMGKIKGLASGISSVTVGSNKQSLVFTTTNGTTVTVSIPNPINTVELCNKLSIDASNHLLYDGKRIAEYTEIPTATSQLTNDSGFITSANLPNLTPYQPKNDTTLNTTNKTVVGAINELKTNVNNISVPTKTSQLTNDSGYITSSDIPTIPSKVSQLANDSDYVTQTEMTDAITNAVTGGTVDLTGYQKSNDTNLATTDKTIVGAINELKGDIDNFEGGSGEGLTNEQKQQLADAYAHSQSPHVSASDIPTKVSELTNDSGYLTANDITIPTKVSDLANDSKFINKDVSNLTNYPTTTTVENTYAKKTDIPTIPTKVSQLSNDSGFITSIPEEYITDTELNAKGYLTEHQDISGLQLKSDTGLATTNKTVVGGINEIKNTADSKSKIITLTEAQYKALSNLDPETYYIISDDTTNISTTINASSTDKEVPSAKASYTELNKKVNKTDIVDNLTSTNIDKPLSANQGKALDDKIEGLRLVGAVQNLYPSTYYNSVKYTLNGVTSVINNDGSVTFNGTATGTHFCVIFHKDYNGLGQAVRLRGKTITMSGGAISPVLSLAFYDEEGNNITPPDNTMIYDTGKGVTLTVPDNAYSIYSYYYISGGTYNNTTLYPMLEEGNVAHSFITPKKTNLTKENLVTTIDSSSTDSQVPTALSIINKMSNSINKDYATSDTMNVNFNKTGFYKFNTPTKGVPENNVKDYTLLNIPWNNCYPSTGQFATQFLFSPRAKGFWFRRVWDYDPDTYVYTEGDYSVFSKWKSVGYVEYAPKIVVFNDNTKYEQNAESNLRYTILNGVCHVTGGINCISPASNLTVVCDNIPKTYMGVYAIGLNIKGVEDNDPVKIYIEGTNLNLRGGVAGNNYRFTFSYPVADS